jgi:hypothetical protein
MTSVILKLFLVALASYRLAHAFSVETGPMAMFENTREYMAKKFGTAHWAYQFSACPLCQSFWLCLVFSLLAFLNEVSFPDFILLWVGSSGLVLIMHLFLYSKR